MYLVTGAGGQLGQELQDVLNLDQAVFMSSKDLDITNEIDVMDAVETIKPTVIINCAAYTKVDLAESEYIKAFDVNHKGAENLAKASKLFGAKLIHISTDYVFAGDICKAYNETDDTKAISVYGMSKRKGEQAVLETAETAIVIRTAWVYSRYGSNFVKTVTKLGQERDELGFIFDQVGSPTYAKDLAEAIVQIIPQIKQGTKEIYNYTNEGAISWYDFTKEILELLNIECKVNPIETFEYPTAAKRPHNSILTKSKIKKDFGLEIRHWKEALKECLNV